MPVQHGDHPQRLFIGRVGDQIIPEANETQRPAGEISAPVALMREGNQPLDDVEDLYNDAVGGNRTVCCNVAPYIVDILISLRVKFVTRVTCHFECKRRASVFAIRRANASSPGIMFTLPLLMSSYRRSSMSRVSASSSTKPETASLTNSSGDWPLSAARSFSFFSSSGVKVTSMTFSIGETRHVVTAFKAGYVAARIISRL